MEQKPQGFSPEEKQAYQPGFEEQMDPKPEYINPNYKGSGKLAGKKALITGGDSGIGRAVAVHFAREGADVAIVYLDESPDAEKTQKLIEAEGRKALLIKADVSDPETSTKAVQQVVDAFGGLNILENTFKTNIFSQFYFAKEALKHLQEGDCIINTTSVTAYRSSPNLIDYSSTKGAITSFTRSLGTNLAEKKIRVNAVAPGPIWTPLIVSTFDEKKIESFGKDVPLGRAGQPSEVAPAYVFLASQDASYITGQVIHVNGGEVVNG